MSKTIEEKYIATMLLHALGDTIGFKNGKWEFFEVASYNATLEKLYEFIDLGGINAINLENWNVSDDTLLHMAIARSLIMNFSNINELEKNTVNNIVKTVDSMNYDKINGKNRYVGNAVDKHVELIKKGTDWKTFNFDPYGGGNGSAMRTHCIGLAYFGEENRNKLIEYAIQSSKITHVNPVGWLGGLSSALLTAFALENIAIYEWIPKMLSIINSENVRKYMSKDNNDEIQEYEQFIQHWRTYYDSRFSDGKPIKTKSNTNLIQRLIFYNNVFEASELSKMGLSGFSAVIVAYDCLIDAGDNWEKLVIYSMINNFDSDTIGAIAGGLYGTVYGLENVPKKNLEFLEFKENLIKIGKLLYKKFYKQETLKI